MWSDESQLIIIESSHRILSSHRHRETRPANDLQPCISDFLEKNDKSQIGKFSTLLSIRRQSIERTNLGQQKALGGVEDNQETQKTMSPHADVSGPHVCCFIDNFFMINFWAIFHIKPAGELTVQSDH